MAYDAFISYSHAADGKLAPAVQAGLQRMAKPWYRPRALHVFRDESGLTVNPDLWGSIEAALLDSAWFVLCCSPEAAASRWVNREVESWLRTKPAERILPVLTDGTVTWDHETGDFTADSTAIPPALRGRYRDAPRYLDLHWARTETQLDLHNSRFRAGIATIAAPIHGITRDELDHEDIHLHRRTIRLARTAIVAFVLLAVALFAVTAADAKANSAKRRADREAAEAGKKTQTANSQATKISQLNNQLRSENGHLGLIEAALKKANGRLGVVNVKLGVANVKLMSETVRADLSASRANAQAALAGENAKRAFDNALVAAQNEQTAIIYFKVALNQANIAEWQAVRANFEKAAADRARSLETSRALGSYGAEQASIPGGLDVGLVYAATGYRRSPHDTLVRDALLRSVQQSPRFLAKVLPGQPSQVAQLAVSSTLGVVASVNSGGALQVSRLSTGAPILLPRDAFFERRTSGAQFAFSGDGHSLFIQRYLQASSAPRAVCVVWNIASQRLRHPSCPDASAHLIAFDQHAQHLAVVGWDGAADSSCQRSGVSGKLTVVDLANPSTIPARSWCVGSVIGVAISPDGSQVATVETAATGTGTGTGTGLTVRQYDVASGSPSGMVTVAQDASDAQLSYVSAPTGLQLVLEPEASSGGTTAIVWDAATMHSLDLYAVPHLGSSESVVGLSADRSRVLTFDTSSAVVRVRDLTTGYVWAQLPGVGLQLHPPKYFSELSARDVPALVKFADVNGYRVVIGDVTGELRVFDTRLPHSGADTVVKIPAITQDVFTQQAVSPDGTLFATATYSAVELVDAHSGRLLATLPFAPPGNGTSCFGIAFDRSGSRLAVTGRDARTKQSALFVWSLTSSHGVKTPQPQYFPLGPKSGIVDSLAFSRDGRFIGINEVFNPSELIDTSDEQPIVIRHSSSFLAFTPAGDAALFRSDSGAVFAWSLREGRETALPFGGQIDAASVEAVLYSRDGNRAAITGPQGVMIYDVAQKKVVTTLPLTSVSLRALSPDGDLLLATNQLTNEAQLYDTRTGLPIGGSFPDTASRLVGAASYTANGREVIVYNDTEHALVRIQTTAQAWQSDACSLVHRNLTSVEWRAFQLAGSGTPHACVG